jgi:hypothetical protein
MCNENYSLSKIKGKIIHRSYVWRKITRFSQNIQKHKNNKSWIGCFNKTVSKLQFTYWAFYIPRRELLRANQNWQLKYTWTVSRAKKYNIILIF